MSFGIPSSADNRALAGVIHRRIKSDASMVAATATFWRLLGVGGFCLLLGAGIGAAFFGYSYITDGQASMAKLSNAIAMALNKAVIKVADVKGTVALDTTNSAVRLDTTHSVVRLDTSDLPHPTEQQMNPSASPQSHATAVTNFTVFKNVNLDNGTVVTGWDFQSSDDSAPRSQYCYYLVMTGRSSSTKYDIASDGIPVTPDPGLPVDANRALANCVWFTGHRT